jgi:hypothetical protein
MRELYVMALYATRPAETDGGGEHEVALRVAMAVEAGEAEARARGLARLLEACPPEGGWVNHHVTARAVDREQLRGVFDALSSEDGEGDGGATELIM